MTQRPPNRALQYLTPTSSAWNKPSSVLRNADTLQKAKQAGCALFERYGDPATQFIKETIRRYPVRDLDGLNEQELKDVTLMFEKALADGLPWMLKPTEFKLDDGEKS